MLLLDWLGYDGTHRVTVGGSHPCEAGSAVYTNAFSLARSSSKTMIDQLDPEGTPVP
jgi:hypothetical protein